jgi:hypothetical protein
MAQSKEIKLAELIANSVEDFYFNPAVVARYLSDQPYYTIDRIMEMLVHIINHQAARHDTEAVDNLTSDGITFARELAAAIKAVRELQEFKNLKLPKSHDEIMAGLPKYDTPKAVKYNWLTHTDESIKVQIEHPFI